jgi:glutathione S-transferase
LEAIAQINYERYKNVKMKAMEKIKVYYWPMVARNAAVIRMLDHAKIPYEWISDKEKMNEVASVWGADSDTFAPPIVIDGDIKVSQQVACAMYIANKCKFLGGGADEAKVLQYCLDVIDVFENGWGKNNESGPQLKKWIEGDRLKALMGNIERSIKGPFYFGEEPCAADFQLFASLDQGVTNIWNPLEAMHNVDYFAAFPKMKALHERLSSTDEYKNSQLKLTPSLKAEVLMAYND